MNSSSSVPRTKKNASVPLSILSSSLTQKQNQQTKAEGAHQGPEKVYLPVSARSGRRQSRRASVPAKRFTVSSSGARGGSYSWRGGEESEPTLLEREQHFAELDVAAKLQALKAVWRPLEALDPKAIGLHLPDDTVRGLQVCERFLNEAEAAALRELFEAHHVDDWSPYVYGEKEVNLQHCNVSSALRGERHTLDRKYPTYGKCQLSQAYISFRCATRFLTGRWAAKCCRSRCSASTGAMRPPHREPWWRKAARGLTAASL